MFHLFLAMAEKKGSLTPTNQEHSCEICGVAGLSDDSMLEHTKACHVDGSALCPFCGLNGVAPAELLLHVNQAHLDYLTPENELMSFIDDQSPRYVMLSYLRINKYKKKLLSDFPVLEHSIDTFTDFALPY